MIHRHDPPDALYPWRGWVRGEKRAWNDEGRCSVSWPHGGPKPLDLVADWEGGK